MRKLLSYMSYLLIIVILVSCGNSSTNYTKFTKEEENRFESNFGFVIPFIENNNYYVNKYKGYNDDLQAEENGLMFVVEELTVEECESYIQLLKDNESYNYEYRQDTYYYFSRNDFFVKVNYYLETNYILEVFVYSYKFNEQTNSSSSIESSTIESSSDNQTIYGFKYEKHSDSYSIIGFYGDEDGIVEIPDYYNALPVCYIRANAFYRQECITEVIIGNNVTVIEGNAFMHCYNLEKVTLGNSLEVIDINVFLGCSQIKEIVIPSSVKSIGYNTFYDCYKLKSITLEDPNGWYTNDNIHKTYPVEDMSNAKTVAKYLTDTHVNHTWMKK